VVVGADPPRELIVASAEDIILQKRWWFQLGGGVSDRQWNDVLGVLKVCGGALDFLYLRRYAKEMKVLHLLNRVLDDAGLTS